MSCGSPDALNLHEVGVRRETIYLFQQELAFELFCKLADVQQRLDSPTGHVSPFIMGKPCLGLRKVKIAS